MTSSSVVRVTTNFLNPLRACEDLEKDEQQNDAVILLNYDLPPNALSFWMSCSYRICADGGANRIQGLWDEYKRAVSELEYTLEEIRSSTRIVSSGIWIVLNRVSPRFTAKTKN